MGRPISLPRAAIAPLPDLTGAACAGRSDLFDLRPVHSDDRAYREALASAQREAVKLTGHVRALGVCVRAQR